MINDSLPFTIRISTGYGIFYSPHLFYSPAVRAVYLAFSSANNQFDPILVGQIVDILAALVAAISVFALVRWFSGSIVLAVLAELTLLAANGFWLFATQVEPYTPMCASLSILAVTLLTKRESLGHVRYVAALVVLLCVALFIHQASILICVPLAYYLVATDPKRGWKSALMVIGASGALVFATFVLVFATAGQYTAPPHDNTLRGFVVWLLGFGLHPDPGWHTFHNYSLSGLSALVQSQFLALAIQPWALRSSALVAFSLFLVGLCGWQLRQILAKKEHWEFRGFFLSWLLVHLAFFLWYLPTDMWFFIPSLIPIIVLSFATVNDFQETLVRGDVRFGILSALSLFIAGLATWNLHESIIPAHESQGIAAKRADGIAARVPAGCFILTDYDTMNHLSYFHKKPTGEVWDLVVYIYYSNASESPYYYHKDDECVAIPTFVVSPEFTVRGHNGFSHPGKWLVLIDWLFSLERDSNGKVLKARDFTVVDDGMGQSYLVVHHHKHDVDGIEELFRTLDKVTQDKKGRPSHAFHEWLSGQAF
jgi:hypothetical protein